jgi:hypothetical protein
MVDQSFSAENFRKIFDYENRKGVYLEGLFFPEAEKLTKKIKDAARDIKNHRREKDAIAADEYEQKKEKLDEIKKILKEKKETLLTKELEKISSEITKNNFSLDLHELDIGTGKKAYSAGSTAAAYFALKQLQYNIRKLYKVQQGNRYNIICQLRELLSDKFPKYLIRTDLSSFYESIPRDKLWKKINDDPLLTLTSKKAIKQILHEYGKLSGQEKGLPRGVGISAYLSELYMRKFDEEIQNAPNVIYYARYVDDIIIVCIPDPVHGTVKIRKLIVRAINKCGLKRNRSKTETYLINGQTDISLDYLGYRFKFGTGSVQISLTKSKLDKYKKRVDLIFNSYQKKSTWNEKKARQNLIKRIKFLTGNTRLLNNKKNAVVGVYFSNSLLTDLSDFKGLDCYLKNKISSISHEKLKSTLSEFSFVEGFEQRKFYKFSTNDLKEIVEVWKYAP